MATLVLLKFDTPDGAERSLDLSERLQKQKLWKSMMRQPSPGPRARRDRRRTRSCISGRSAVPSTAPFGGCYSGLCFSSRSLGVAVGAGMGGLSGHLGYCGIDDDFIRQVRTKVTEGTSGLFLLLGTVTTDKVVEAPSSLHRISRSSGPTSRMSRSKGSKRRSPNSVHGPKP